MSIQFSEDSRASAVLRPSLMRIAGMRILLAAALAFLLQVVICLAEFRDEMYYAQHYVNLEADRLAKSASFEGDRLSLTPGSSLSHFFGDDADAYAFRILDPSGLVLAAHNEPLLEQVNSGQRSGQIGLHNWLRKFNDDNWFHIVGAVTRDIAGRKVSIEVATSGDPDKQRIFGLFNDFWDDVWTPVTPTIFLITLFTFFALRGAFRPMLQQASFADEITPGHDIQQFDLSGLPKEAASFAGAINRLLARNQALIRSQHRLMASTAHELRTPLHVMMLELANIEDPVARRLEADVKKMGERIDRLLALARLEMITETEQAPIDLPAIVLEEVDRLMPLLKSRNNTIAKHFVCAKPFKGDPQSIKEAVRNLIENASRHTPMGSKVAVTCGPGTRLIVEDSGRKPSEADKIRLLAPYHRGVAPSDGTGLGLAIVKQTVELHKGSISLEQSDLGGARFIIDFVTPVAEV